MSAQKQAKRAPSFGALEQLDADVLDALDAELANAKRITRALIARLDAKWSLCGRTGLSSDSLAKLARKRKTAMRKQKDGEPDSASAGRAPVVSGGSNSPLRADIEDAELAAYRARQASVSSILDQVFGRLAECDPSLWERRAYLMIVGMVYERLATGLDEVHTEELVKLAKALSETRRAMSKTDAIQESSAIPVDPSEVNSLPPRVAHAVRLVYGTSLPESPNGRAEDEDNIETKAGEAGG